MSVVISPLSESLNNFLADKSYSKIIVLVDDNTYKKCYPLVKKWLPNHKLIRIKSGEHAKNLDTCTHIWDKMTQFNTDRHALMINVGGGVIGDMGGFCASAYKRGIDFIQIPTTLLSQVDASVGGKLGIDFNGFKNHIGTFTLPAAVLIDSVFLATLPSNELKSGFAEIVKHCLIKDKNMWNTIKVKDLDQQNFDELINHSVAIKKEVVAIDPTEKGLRKILNFGHTIGHAVETFFLDKGKLKLLHGEAIAMGMIAESYLSFSKKLIDEKTLIEIEEFIFSVFGSVKINAKDFDKIASLALQDKKNKGNVIRASLLNNLGSCVYDIVITKNDIKNALNYYSGH